MRCLPNLETKMQVYSQKHTITFFLYVRKKVRRRRFKWGAATPQPLYPHISTSSHSLTFTIMVFFLFRKDSCLVSMETIFLEFFISVLHTEMYLWGVFAPHLKRRRDKTNKYNYLLSNYIFIPLACEISGVWCVEGIDFLNELGRRTSIVTGDKK